MVYQIMDVWQGGKEHSGVYNCLLDFDKLPSWLNILCSNFKQEANPISSSERVKKRCKIP